MLILKENAANSVPTPPVGKDTFFIDDSGVPSIKNASGNVTTFPTVNASNAQVVFMDGTSLSGEAALTYNFNTNVLNVQGNLAAGNILTDNLLYANGLPWDLSDPGGSNTQIQFNDDESFGGSAALTFNKSSNVLTLSGNLSANLITGTLTTNAQPNITSVGQLQVLSVQSNITAGNIYANSGVIGALALVGTLSTSAQPNITSVGVLSSLSVSGNANVGNIGATNGIFTTISGTLSTNAQPNITSVGTLTGLGVNGNITAANITANTGVFTGNGAGLTNIPGGNIVGNISGNISNAAHAVTANTVVDGAQPNITSVGTLSSVSVSGNANVGNLNSAGTIAASRLQSNVAQGTAPLSVVSTTKVANLNADLLDGFDTDTNATANTVVVRDSASNFSANVITANVLSGRALTANAVVDAAQPNITSVGTLSSLAVTGNATAGNVYANSGTIGATNLAGTLTTAAQNNITSVGTLSSLTVTNKVAAGQLQGEGGNISNVQAGNISGQVANALVAGTVYTNAQPNITSVGTLSSLAVTGNASAGNISTGGILSVTGNANVGNIGATNGVLTGNLSVSGTLGVTGNANVGNIGATNGVFTGNVTAGTINASGIANGTSNLAIPSANGNVNISVDGNANVLQVTSTGILTTGTVNAAGNLTAHNLNTGGALSVTGNANIGNIGAAAGIFTANVTAANVYANSGTVGAANLVGTIQTAAQNNITSVGTLTDLSVAGNAVVGGNLTVNGNLVYMNVETLAVEDPIINLQTGPNGAAPTSNSGKDVGSALNYYDTQARIAFMGWDTSNTEFGLASVATIANEVVTFSTYGNLRVGNIIGNGQALTGIAGGNVTGQVANALVAGTVYTNAQPNITSVGTLTGLGVNGNITAANITANTGVFTGNGSGLSALAGGNVTGQVANALVAGTVYTNAQPNITSVGTLTGLGVNGNITAANITANTGVFTGNGSGLSALAGANVTGQVGNALVAGTVYTNAQPNITSVGTLSSLAVTGNATAGNVYANSGTIGAANLTGTLTTAAQTNITSVGTLTGLGVNGNITAANITANTGVFTGNAAGLTNIPSANINGQVANALVAGTVYTNAQPNITSVGTLSSVAVTGNATAGNVYANSGTIGAANLTGTLTTAAQTNITSVGTLTGLGVNGNITAANITANTGVFTGNGSGLSALAGANVTGQVGNALVSGTVYTNAQPNITSVGTLSSLAVTGNVAAGNLTTTGILSVTGTGTSSIAGNLDMTGNTITNLATPTNATDAATKQYVDDVAQGLNVHDSCAAATPDTLANVTGGTITYNNGTAGVGAFLATTGTFNLIDGVNVQTAGTRILVKNEANAVHNGIYTYTNTTAITRAADFNSIPEVEAGDFVFVTGGTLYDNTGWVQTDSPAAIGTAGNNINFTQFSGAGTYTAGTGLTLNGSAFSVNASQTQITSVGTLTGLAVNGNITAANITANTGVFTGNGSGLSALAGGNVTGQVGNALVAGTVYTAAQPNITSVGTLTSLGVNGTVTAVAFTANTGVFTGNGNGLSSIQGANVVGTVSSATSATTAGTVTTAAQPNITSVGTLTSLAVTGNTTSGNFIGIFANGNSNISIPAANGNINISAGGTPNELVITNTGINVAGTLNATGNANVGNIGAAAGVFTTVAGSLTTASQPNITSVGTLTSLAVTGNATVGNLIGPHANGNSNINVPAANGNVTVTVAGNANVLVVTGTGVNVAGTLNTGSGVITGNGSGLSALAGANVTGQVANALVAGTVYTNAQPNITSVGTLTSLGVSGAVTASTLVSNVATGTAPLTVTSTTRVANLNVATSGVANTVNDAAQPNITSVGTLTSLTVSGNISAGNITGGALANGNSNVNIPAAAGNVNISVNGTANVLVVTATGANIAGTLNATGNANVGNIGATNGVFTNVSGNGSALSAITGANVTGQVGNALVAGTVYTNAQPNITSVGTLTSVTVTGTATAGNLSTGGNLSVSGNAVISGNLTVDGNLVYVNVDTLAVEDPIINLQTGPNGAAPTSNSGKDVGTALNYFDTAARVAFMGWDVSNSEFGLASVASISSEVVTFTTYGNLRVGNIIGNGQALTGLAGANVTGQVANALVAGTVYTNAQPNITSVGTLTSLAVTGNATAGNVYANSGTIGASLLTGTLTTAAQPNVTSLGTLTGLGVNGNITAANITANTGVFTGNGSGLSALNASNISSGTLAQARLANASLTVNGVSIALGGTGTVTANTTQTLTLGSFLTGTSFNGGTAVTANVDATSANTASKVVARDASGNFSAGTITATLSGAATTAGTVTTAAQPNITSVGTLTSLTVSGNITGQAYYVASTNAAVSAAGTVQGNATVLASQVNVTSTVASGAGVALPTAVAGVRVTIINTAANAVLVYPASGGVINSLATNAAYSLPANGRLDFQAVSTTQWFTLNATYA